MSMLEPPQEEEEEEEEMQVEEEKKESGESPGSFQVLSGPCKLIFQ